MPAQRVAPSDDLAQWLRDLPPRLHGFMDRLAVPGAPGRFLPALTGLTTEGRAVDLGFSCFAAKLYLMLGWWEEQPPQVRQAWIDHILAFERPSGRGPLGTGAYIDPAVVDTLRRAERSPRALLRRLRNLAMANPAPVPAVALAETKQARATLHALGAAPRHAYADAPTDAGAIAARLRQLDWRRPWAAGGRASGLVTVLCLQNETEQARPAPQGWRAAAASVFESLLDEASGAYCAAGSRPARGNLVNGAMKVLTALDWLELPPHRPERLIDTCLAQAADPQGCHIVDVLYVLHQCAAVTPHRRGEIAAFALRTIEQTRRHEQPDGGFSYEPHRAQTTYYGVPINEGVATADLHGTLLLVWGIGLALRLIDSPPISLAPVRP